MGAIADDIAMMETSALSLEPSNQASDSPEVKAQLRLVA
jgi:hypothetical protein